MKKSKPRRWKADPMAVYSALYGVTPVNDAGPEITRIRIIAHDAMDVMRRGQATRGHLQVIVEVSNMVETLATHFRLGSDWLPEIRQSQACIRALAARGVELGRYVLKGAELSALNLMYQIYESQLNACSVKTLLDASEHIRRRLAAGDFTRLPAIKEAA